MPSSSCGQRATNGERLCGGTKRAKYLVCNIYDATLKIIAVAKVKANIVIHICSSITWQAGARPVSQPPAAWAILVSLDGAAADDSSSMRLLPKTSLSKIAHSDGQRIDYPPAFCCG
jgi:hypothetical protein